MESRHRVMASEVRNSVSRIRVPKSSRYACNACNLPVLCLIPPDCAGQISRSRLAIICMISLLPDVRISLLSLANALLFLLGQRFRRDSGFSRWIPHFDSQSSDSGVPSRLSDLSTIDTVAIQ